MILVLVKEIKELVLANVFSNVCQEIPNDFFLR